MTTVNNRTKTSLAQQPPRRPPFPGALLQVRYCLAATAACIVLFSGTADVNAAPEDLTPAIGPPAAQEQVFLSEIEALLNELNRQNLFNSENDENRAKVLNAIVESVAGAGAELVEVEPTPEPEDNNRPPLKQQILRKSFFYLYTPAVGDELVKKLSAGLQARKETTEGIILDLRSSRDGALEAARKAAEQLKQQNDPVVVLINSETAGAAEFLARLAKHELNAFLVGLQTAGRPFPFRVVSLSSGLRLRLPDVPDDLSIDDLPLAPLKPDVQVDCPASESAETDPCVQKALDLLITVQAFSSRHF